MWGYFVLPADKWTKAEINSIWVFRFLPCIDNSLKTSSVHLILCGFLRIKKIQFVPFPRNYSANLAPQLWDAVVKQKRTVQASCCRSVTDRGMYHYCVHVCLSGQFQAHFLPFFILQYLSWHERLSAASSWLTILKGRTRFRKHENSLHFMTVLD